MKIFDEHQQFVGDIALSSVKPVEKEPAHTSCVGCNTFGKVTGCAYGCVLTNEARKNYTPAPAPAPIDEMKCSGQNCMWDRSRLAFDSGHCVGCHDFTPKQPAPDLAPKVHGIDCLFDEFKDCNICEANPHEPAPKVTDAPTEEYAIQLQRAIEYHCKGDFIPQHISIKCPHHAMMLDAFIRTLSQRAGEGYSAKEWEAFMLHWESNRNGKTLYDSINDPQDGIKAVTKRKGG